MPTNAAAPSATDMSFMHLFSQATPLVKGVMILLIVFSLVSWTIIFIKWLDFMKSNAALKRLEEKLATTNQPLVPYKDESGHPVQDIINAGNKEWQEGAGENTTHETQHEASIRIAETMRLQMGVENRRLQTMLPFLASVGSASPFIGLFGTVWGIMNTFTQIGQMRDTSLATVAPGIAEALIATGIGLAAAIPAIMAYNAFTTSLGRYNGRLGTASGSYANRLSKRKAA